MDKLKTKIRNVFKGSKTKKGFSLMELIVVIAIMVIMLAVLAPSLIHYVEDTRAKKDTSASSEMTNAVTMGLTNQDVYDELIKNSVKGNVSCYIDSPTEEGYEKIESSSKYTFDNNARLLDEVPYHPAGNMYGMTITFEPKQKSNGSDTEYSLKDGIVNKYVPEKTQLLTENENLYAALRKVVGEKVELNSQTYRNSELTIFVQVGSRKGSDIITTDAVEVYSQFSGTNLPADTEIEYIPTTDRVIDYVYNDPDEPIGGGTGGSGTLPDGGGSGTTGGNTEHTHSYEKQVTSPTCQNQGYTTYVCTCGDSYVDEESYVDKVGHSYTSTIEKYATCTATGIKSLKCSICGNTETAEIAKLGHDYKDDVIQATCTTNGYTVHTCSRCGDTYQDNQTVAGGHQWSDWTVTKEANCKNEGLRNRKCNLCNHQENEIINALGHNYNNVVTEPTCTTEGYTTHTCSKCGDVYTDSKTDKKNHTFGDWTTNKEPSCEVAGERFRICTTCSQTEYSTIDQLGHDYKDDYTTDVAATCTTVGRKSQHCSRCNSTRNNVEIPALGHDWNNGSETIKPTCESAGTKVYTCNTCGATKSEDLNATGHNYKETVTPPTTTSEGYTLHTCLNCGLSYKDNFVEKITFTVSGTVKVLEDFVSNVTIELTQNSGVLSQVITNSNGKFELTKVSVGTYDLVIKYKGYEWTENIEVQDNISLSLSYTLDPGFYDSNNNLLISWADLTSKDFYTIEWEEEYEYYDENYYGEGDGGWVYGYETKQSPIINVSEDGTLTTAWNSYSYDNLSSWTISSILSFGGCNYYEYDEYGDYICQYGKLVISDSVTTIGNNAFYDFYADCDCCSLLDVVILPETIVSIGNNAFNYCTSRINKIPSSVTSIGDYAFSYCTLIDTTIPSTLTSIGTFAFDDTNIKEFYIPKNVTYIGGPLNSQAISIEVDENNPIYDSRNDCNAIIETATNILIGGCKNTVIPDTIAKIGDYAFSYVYDYNASSTSIELPNSVIDIGSYAFCNCDNLKSITMTDNVVSIGESAFRDCGIKEIKLSANLNEIPQYAFYYCDSLTSIEIPNNITNIDLNAFQYCTNLSSITLSDNLTNLGEYAFYYTRKLKNVIIPGTLKTIPYSAFEFSGLENLIIEEGVEKIDSYAFDYCYYLESITLPSTITSISSNAFDNPSPSYVSNADGYWYNVDTGMAYSIPQTGVAATYTAIKPAGLYNDSKTTMLYSWQQLIERGYLNVSETTITSFSSDLTGTLFVKDGITVIGDNAFANNSLTAISLPTTLITIDNGAFENCSLTNIALHSGVTSVGNNAFKNCSSLATVSIPSSLTTIGNNAFDGCAIKSIDLDNYGISIGREAFANCKYLSQIELSSSSSIGENAFPIPDSNYIQGATGKWYNTYGLVGYEPNKISKSGTYSAIKKVDAGGYDYDFDYDYYAWDTLIDRSAIIVENNILYKGTNGGYSNSIWSIIVEDGIVAIEANAFDCFDTRLQSIKLPSSLLRIEDSAFAISTWSDIESIIMDKNVEYIGHSIVSRSSTIYFTGTEEEWNAIEKESDWAGEYNVKVVYNYSDY